jgi:hypothetical protein
MRRETCAGSLQVLHGADCCGITIARPRLGHPLRASRPPDQWEPLDILVLR